MNTKEKRLQLAVLDAKKQDLQKSDAIIVLGRVDNYGYLNIDAHERIRYTFELFNNKLAPIIVAPAKWSYKLTYIPPRTEAATIKARLIEWGIPPNAILCEEQSCDTLGAAYFLRTMFVEPRGWKKIIIVTSLDHYERTKYVFHKVFGDCIELQYAWGNQVFSDQEFESSLEREAKSLQLMERTWVGPIAVGDYHHVRKVLDKHPFYNSKTLLTAEEIERRIQSQDVGN